MTKKEQRRLIIEERREVAEKILCELNKRKVRATYGAVACIVGGSAHGVSYYLGDPRPWASWIVNGKSERPTNYEDGQMHRNLFDDCHVIKSCSELRERLGWPLDNTA